MNLQEHLFAWEDGERATLRLTPEERLGRGEPKNI
jgi:hypothetical protein